jgi:DNA-binding MarR family transcriptional regulator
MSRIIDSMEKRDLLERRQHPDDGRVRVVHLTKHGRALEKKLVPLVERIVARMTDGIDERALVVTRDALRAMYANLIP